MQQPDRLNLLMAYPYADNSNTSFLSKNKARTRLLLDSGAFTAWKLGKPVDLDDYCTFIEEGGVSPWRYFMLDVIGDPQATRKNYSIMLQRGLNPIPVFTRGEDPRALDDYFAHSDVVGLGGLAGLNQPPYGYLKWLWPQLNGRKVHILGFSSMPWVKILRPYSCDSSSWERAARYGRADIYLGNGQMVRATKAHFAKRPPAHILRAVEALGLDPYAFQKLAAWHGDVSLARWLSAASFVAAQIDLGQHMDVLFFQAFTGAMAAQILMGCFERQTTGQWGEYAPDRAWRTS